MKRVYELSAKETLEALYRFICHREKLVGKHIVKADFLPAKKDGITVLIAIEER